MGSFIVTMLNNGIKGLANALTAILSILPKSPFDGVIDVTLIKPYMGTVNYFIPVGAMLNVFTAYLGCVAIYYVVSVVLRFANVID